MNYKIISFVLLLVIFSSCQKDLGKTNDVSKQLNNKEMIEVVDGTLSFDSFESFLSATKDLSEQDELRLSLSGFKSASLGMDEISSDFEKTQNKEDLDKVILKYADLLDYTRDNDGLSYDYKWGVCGYEQLINKNGLVRINGELFKQTKSGLCKLNKKKSFPIGVPNTFPNPVVTKNVAQTPYRQDGKRKMTEYLNVSYRSILNETTWVYAKLEVKCKKKSWFGWNNYHTRYWLEPISISQESYLGSAHPAELWFSDFMQGKLGTVSEYCVRKTVDLYAYPALVTRNGVPVAGVCQFKIRIWSRGVPSKAIVSYERGKFTRDKN